MRQSISARPPISPNQLTDGASGCGRVQGDMEHIVCGAEAFPNDADESDEALASQELNAEDEDVQPQKPLPTLILPSKADVDGHNIDHIPYRAWCDSCVCGQGQERPHVRVQQERRKIAILSFDYLFVGRKDIYTRPEWEAGARTNELDYLKVLVAKDSMSLSTFAHAVEKTWRR